MNYIGENLRLEIFGGSHEPELGMTLRGFPAGEAVDAEALASFLARRAPGRSAWSSPRSEKDEPLFRSGLTDGMSDGSPIPAVIANTIVVPLVLRYGYGIDMPLVLLMVYIAIGEIVGCCLLGQLLGTLLWKRRGAIFRSARGSGEPEK